MKAKITNVTINGDLCLVTYDTGSEKRYPADKLPKTVTSWMEKHKEAKPVEEPEVTIEEPIKAEAKPEAKAEIIAVPTTETITTREIAAALGKAALLCGIALAWLLYDLAIHLYPVLRKGTVKAFIKAKQFVTITLPIWTRETAIPVVIRLAKEMRIVLAIARFMLTVAMM